MIVVNNIDETDPTIQKRKVQEDSQIVIRHIDTFQSEQNVRKKSVDKKSFENTHGLDVENQVLTQIDALLLQDIDDITTITKNMSQLFSCDECIEKLRFLLVSDVLNKQTLEELVTSVSLLNSKESADLLIDVMAESIKADKAENVPVIERAFANFDNPEVAESLASFLYERSEDVALSYDTQYAIEKTIHKTTDRDLVASKLAQMYQNSADEETKAKLANLNYPEMYAVVAADSYNRGDTDTYDAMVENLTKTTKEEALNGFMLLARKNETGTVDEITKVASQWSSTNASPRVLEIAEDYLSKSDTTPKERIIASAILSSMQNSEKRNQILNKALDHEEDGDVVACISERVDMSKE